jgi:hypothetical protein
MNGRRPQVRVIVVERVARALYLDQSLAERAGNDAFVAQEAKVGRSVGGLEVELRESESRQLARVVAGHFERALERVDLSREHLGVAAPNPVPVIVLAHLLEQLQDASVAEDVCEEERTCVGELDDLQRPFRCRSEPFEKTRASREPGPAEPDEQVEIAVFIARAASRASEQDREAYVSQRPKLGQESREQWPVPTKVSNRCPTLLCTEQRRPA